MHQDQEVISEYPDDIWDGTADTESIVSQMSKETIIISTAEMLAGLGELINAGNPFDGKTVVLAANVDLTGTDWNPIGTNTNRFRGDFDGSGHSIIGMVAQGDDGGLFGVVAGSTISNVEVSGGVNGIYSAGGIAGMAFDAVFDNCINHATVHLSDNDYAYGAGGIVGQLYCGEETEAILSISNSYNYGTVTADGNQGIAGGIVGYVCDDYREGELEITEVFNFGEIKGESVSGGLIGICIMLSILPYDI